MGKIALHKRIIAYITILLTITFIILFLYGYMVYRDNDYDRSANTRRSRVKYADLVYAVEQDDLMKVKSYQYAVINLDGTVKESNTDDYKVGENVDLHTLSKAEIEIHEQKKSLFVSPIIKHKVQVGTIVIIRNKAFHMSSKQVVLFIPIIFIISIASLITYKLIIILKKDVFIPISTMHTVTKEIIKGNYDTKLVYDYDGDIGVLCHDVELLRDELESSNRRENQLRENEKLLLACISHDLKTPLAAISGYVEGIRDGIVKDEEGIKRYTSIIMKKIKLLSKLIDDILEHSKAELNEFSIEKEEVYAREYFGETFNELSIDVVQSGLVFEIGVIPNILIEIDKKRILQVVQNIISNSIKYTMKGGNLNVNFEIIDDELVISIADNGKGIDAADIPFVFDKFYRGEKARTLNVAGSGLGLNIAKYIVNKHGGKIECDSVLDTGTTVSFSLPI